jgi:hypothetical protein
VPKADTTGRFTTEKDNSREAVSACPSKDHIKTLSRELKSALHQFLYLVLVD